MQIDQETHDHLAADSNERAANVGTATVETFGSEGESRMRAAEPTSGTVQNIKQGEKDLGITMEVRSLVLPSADQMKQ